MYTDFGKQLTSFMDQKDIRLDEPMKDHTSFRIGGPAKLFLNIRSESILKKVLLLLREREIPYFARRLSSSGSLET